MDTLIGQTVGSYRVLALLGEGGMGVVYKALDVRLQRHVALKVLSAEGSSDEQRRRFLQEARAASALNDPHIITIYDVVSQDGTDVLVMELVEGRTLRAIVQNGPVPLKRALDWTAQPNTNPVPDAAGLRDGMTGLQFCGTASGYTSGVGQEHTIFSAPAGTQAQRRWSLTQGYEGLTPGHYTFTVQLVVTPTGGGKAFIIDPEMDIDI